MLRGRILWVAPLLLASATVAADETAVAFGSTWRYLDDGSDSGSAWREPGFDDSSWASGPAQLGYGDGDEATVVGYGPDPNAKFATTYFRATFDVEDPAAWRGIRARLLRDDGGIVWLNGVEAYRNGMPPGAVGYSQYASLAVTGQDEKLARSFAIDPSLLVAGTNTVAVEIHQGGPTGSDLSFDLEAILTPDVFVSRGPYLQSIAPDRVVVRWRTSSAAPGRVYYGAEPGPAETEGPPSPTGIEHAVVLSGLEPGTAYRYAIATDDGVLEGGGEEHRFRTPPVAGTREPVRIWVLGDSGTANFNARAVRDAFDAHAGDRIEDVWLMLGDNAYQFGQQDDYLAAVFETYPKHLRRTCLWPTYGNHDGYAADSATQTGPYYAIFDLPGNGECGGVPSGTEAYYSFDHANIHFVCLDSFESSRAAEGAMVSWLAEDLAATTQEWLIAFWHHPPYSKGSHDSDAEAELIDMRENVLPVLEAFGVDLVLAGHSHSYERSHLLDGHYGASTTLEPAMVRDGGGGDPAVGGPYAKATGGLLARAGAVYVVAGSSGQISGGTLDHPAMFASINSLGSLVVDVDGHRLEARFVDAAGEIRDVFAIEKDPDFGASWEVR